jgi:hypothetical protein
MNERQRTARDRLRVIVAQAPRKEPAREEKRPEMRPRMPSPERDAGLPGLREVPSLPLRVGRHLTAWVIWHTTRVSLVSDSPPPRELDRTAHV